MRFSRIFLPSNKTNSFFGSKMGGGLIYGTKLYTGKYGYWDASLIDIHLTSCNFGYIYISWFIPLLVDLHFIWRFGILHLIFSTKEWSWRTKKEDRKSSHLTISYAECYTHIGKLQDSNGMEMRSRANNSRGGAGILGAGILDKVFWAKGHSWCIMYFTNTRLFCHIIRWKKVSDSLTLKLKWLYGASVLVTMFSGVS